MYTLLKRHLFMLEGHHSRQTIFMHDFENKFREGLGNKFRETIDLYNYVFLFVDLAVRIQKISHAIPRVNQNTPEYIKFNEALGSLKDVRNRFQHINKDVSAEGTSHLLGTISWFSNSRTYNLSFQDMSRKRNGQSMPFEVTVDHKLKIKHGLCYILENYTFDLDAIFEACILLGEFLDTKIILKDENGPIDLRERYDAWSLKFTEVEGGVKIEYT